MPLWAQQQSPPEQSACVISMTGCIHGSQRKERRRTTRFFFSARFVFSRSGPRRGFRAMIITISATTPQPPIQVTGNSLILRAWYTNEFIAGDGVTPVLGWNGTPEGFFYEIT